MPGLSACPMAGKSTFLARVTHARPKIADYPFTTLRPQLGVVRMDDREVVLADLPGLIEGASEGAGLGTPLLGHVERCARGVLHLVDGTADDIVDAYRTIRGELAGYGHGLVEKPEIICLNKIDAIDPAAVKGKCRALARAAGRGAVVLPLSGVSGEGVPSVLGALIHAIEAQRTNALVEA